MILNFKKKEKKGRNKRETILSNFIIFNLRPHTNAFLMSHLPMIRLCHFMLVSTTGFGMVHISTCEVLLKIMPTLDTDHKR